MKVEELEKRFNELIANPDTMTANAGALLEEIKSDYALADEVAEKIATTEKRIKDLQEANIKLYLAQTGTDQNREGTNADDYTEEDGEDFINNVFEKLEGEQDNG